MRDDFENDKSRSVKISIIAVVILILLVIVSKLMSNYIAEKDTERLLKESNKNTNKEVTEVKKDTEEKIDYEKLIEGYYANEREYYNEYIEGKYEEIINVNTAEADGTSCLSAEQFVYAWENKKDTLKGMNILFKDFDFLKMSEDRTRVFMVDGNTGLLVVLKYPDSREIFPEDYFTGTKFTQSVKIDNINIVKYENINIAFCNMDTE